MATACRAAFGKAEIMAQPGTELVGYRAAGRTSAGVHDQLFARALVLECGGETVALCVLDLCCFGEDLLAAARERIERTSGLPGSGVFVAATHSHSAPGDLESRWSRGPVQALEKAVLEAEARLEPARVGAGWGMVHGCSLNRRRFEDPVDPALIVVRIDSLGGRPLGAFYGFGCHPVTLGPDNRLVSGDWPAAASAAIERRLGDGAVAIFGQGACGDVNPLTAELLERLGRGTRVESTIPGAGYYGNGGRAAATVRIGDRGGGRFAEADEVGGAVAAEALRVHAGIAVQPPVRLWTRRQIVDLGPVAHSKVEEARLRGHSVWPRGRPADPIEIMAVGVEGPGAFLVGVPGEIFAETGVRIRRALRGLGFPHSYVLGYANGWRGYLPPSTAFPEGGYEVEWARARGVPPSFERQLSDAVVALAGGRAGAPASDGGGD